MIKTKERATMLSTEFKEFAGKTAALSTAVGIMIGATFKDVIDSLVNDILTPPINYLTSGFDLSSLYFVLGTNPYSTLEQAKEAGAIVIEYGRFINSFISFLITALVLFIFVYKGTKALKKTLHTEEQKKKKITKECPYCFSEINKKATRCPNCTSKLN